DNERGIATGWLPGRLSPSGEQEARKLGTRRRNDGIDTVFTSDLARAVQTATIAFAGSAVPILHDWRLRECDYGERNGMPADELRRNQHLYIDQPYPGGESWQQAVNRVGRFLDDLPMRWNGTRVLVIGHVATKWAFDHIINGRPLIDLVTHPFEWQEG